MAMFAAFQLDVFVFYLGNEDLFIQYRTKLLNMANKPTSYLLRSD